VQWHSYQWDASRFPASEHLLQLPEVLLSGFTEQWLVRFLRQGYLHPLILEMELVIPREPLQWVWNFIFLLKLKVSIDTTSVLISRVLESEPCLDITDTIVPACVICLQWNAYNTPRWEYPNAGLWHACLSAICSSHSLQVCILDKCWLTPCSQVVKTASDIYNCLHEMKTWVLAETGFSWY
jgi:hypothetical protein